MLNTRESWHLIARPPRPSPSFHIATFCRGIRCIRCRGSRGRRDARESEAPGRTSHRPRCPPRGARWLGTHGTPASDPGETASRAPCMGGDGGSGCTTAIRPGASATSGGVGRVTATAPPEVPTGGAVVGPFVGSSQRNLCARRTHQGASLSRIRGGSNGERQQPGNASPSARAAARRSARGRARDSVAGRGKRRGVTGMREFDTHAPMRLGTYVSSWLCAPGSRSDRSW